jgi:hypothetical protein
MKYIYEHKPDTSLAREYVEKRTWEAGVETLNRALE